jgi:hypothetical protein
VVFVLEEEHFFQVEGTPGLGKVLGEAEEVLGVIVSICCQCFGFLWKGFKLAAIDFSECRKIPATHLASL